MIDHEPILHKETPPSPEKFRPLVDVITISGPAGTGKTVVGERLANLYGMDFVKAGQIFRNEHRSRTGEEVIGYAERDIDIDRNLDEMQADIIRNAASAERKVILEGRLAHVIATEVIVDDVLHGKKRPDIFRVLFTADPMIRALRVQKRYPGLTPEEALAKNAEREQGDLERWRSLHPIISDTDDVYDAGLQDESGFHPFFDYIVDTTDMTQEQTVESIHQYFLENDVVAETLTKDHALELFHHSFTFSQGNPFLQNSLLQYISNEHPAWRMTDEVFQQVRNDMIKKATAYLSFTQINGSPIVAHPNYSGEIEEEITDRLSEWKDILNSPRLPVDIREITKTIIERDFKFLIDEQSGIPIGRPRTHERNRFLSHICHYAWKGTPTGSAEYDELFKDIRNLVDRGGLVDLDWDEDARLTKVIDCYNSLHPDGVEKPAFISQE